MRYFSIIVSAVYPARTSLHAGKPHSMNEQTPAGAILMIRPARFGINAETAASNRFQRLRSGSEELTQAARREFDAAARALSTAGVVVEVFDDTPEPARPDAVFPNNWVSFHADGTVCLYPMLADNRRRERRPDILEMLQRDRGYHIERVDDWSAAESDGRYLEGTGSLVLDRANRIAYASLSPRTDAGLVQAWCRQFGYRPILFHAVDAGQVAVYHTNVLMCVGDRFAVVCLDCIQDETERATLIACLESTGHQLVPITTAQMQQFAGNLLLLRARDGTRILAMSTRAEQSLDGPQRQLLQSFAHIVSSPLDTIEDCAGGSMRCMIAELFLPHRPASGV